MLGIEKETREGRGGGCIYSSICIPYVLPRDTKQPPSRITTYHSMIFQAALYVCTYRDHGSRELWAEGNLYEVSDWL